MVFAPTDDTIWWTMFACTFFFTGLGSYFPVNVLKGERMPTGIVWAYVRGGVFPIFASVSWYIDTAFSVAAANSGTHILYYYFWMFTLVYLVIGIAMIIYLAFHPVVEVLEGREKLENG